MIKKMMWLTMFGILCVVTGIAISTFFDLHGAFQKPHFFSPFVSHQKELPYLQYTIPHLQAREYHLSQISIIKVVQDTPEYTAYEFAFTTLGKKMTGQLNIPKAAPASAAGYPVIVMIRGFVPLNIYSIGVGTKSGAAVLAQHGYVTVAPDFFGYGESDSETTDAWAARFQKPISIVELIKTIQATATIKIDSTLTPSGAPQSISLNTTHLGIWAHSNGGQIALTTLELLRQPIPTTLWAPVTAPFPYSILYFSDEDPDEGKATRQWIAQFEEEYNAFDFSLTQHLDALQGPLQLHQGLSDEAIHYTWSQKFVDKIKAENVRRAAAATQSATATSTNSSLKNNSATPQLTAPISITFYTYPGTDHNMRPSWDTVIQRDVEFFDAALK